MTCGRRAEPFDTYGGDRGHTTTAGCDCCGGRAGRALSGGATFVMVVQTAEVPKRANEDTLLRAGRRPAACKGWPACDERHPVRTTRRPRPGRTHRAQPCGLLRAFEAAYHQHRAERTGTHRNRSPTFPVRFSIVSGLSASTTSPASGSARRAGVTSALCPVVVLTAEAGRPREATPIHLRSGGSPPVVDPSHHSSAVMGRDTHGHTPGEECLPSAGVSWASQA